MNQCAAEITVSGLVHGVGYRYFCTRAAKELSLKGWVINNKEETVSIFVEGQRDLIETLIKELSVGPPGSKVKDLEIVWLEYTDCCKKFEIRY